jgi:alkylated DNA repair dioxygenase AlkB
MALDPEYRSSQRDLFCGAEPEGFIYRPGIISADEECKLSEQIAALPLEAFRFQGFVAKRRVRSFGWHYDFDHARFEQTEPIPDFLQSLKARAASLSGLGAHELVHALVTGYPPGTPIGWHRDRPVFEEVIGVSLLSPCFLSFRRKLRSKWQRYTIVARPRSIYLMRGPARWEWERSIPEVKMKRYSVTFRTLRMAA